MRELLEIQEADVQEHFFAADWTDGLPIVAPTPDRVIQMLGGDGIGDADEVIGGVPHRDVVVTAEHAAINAVTPSNHPRPHGIRWR